MTTDYRPFMAPPPSTTAGRPANQKPPESEVGEPGAALDLATATSAHQPDEAMVAQAAKRLRDQFRGVAR
jgi:hypothetical protein